MAFSRLKPDHLRALYKSAAWKVMGWTGRTHLLRTNHFKIEVSTHDQVIGRNFYLYGSYGLDELQRAIDYLHELGLFRKGVVLDLGANIGFVSLYLLSKNYATHAVCVEPEPFNFTLLGKNFEHNGWLQRHTGYNVGLSSIRRRGKLILSNDNYGDHRVFTANESAGADKYNQGERGVIDISLSALDDIAATDPHLSDLSLVCLDVQGYELEVLTGGRTVFDKGPPLLIEIDPYLLEKKGSRGEDLARELARAYTHFMDISGTARQRPVTDFISVYEGLKRAKVQHTDLLMFRRATGP